MPADPGYDGVKAVRLSQAEQFLQDRAADAQPFGTLSAT